MAGRASYDAYRVAAAAARSMPGPLAHAASRAVSLPMAGAMRTRRLVVSRHLRRVDPSLTGLRLRRSVQRAFDSYARYWVESFRLADATPESLAAGMDAVGLQHIDAALAGGTGVVAIMPHLGGWDFGGAYLATQGYPVTVVAERLDPPELFDWFVDLRGRLGVKVVPLDDQAGAATLAALRRNEVVGLISDRDLSGSGIEVEFFGETTTLPGGPATLALRTGAPILPMAVYFDDDDPGMHHGVVLPPLDTRRQGRLREDVTRVTQQVAAALEDLIRRAPDQWHLFQPNWPSDHEALRRLVIR